MNINVKKKLNQIKIIINQSFQCLATSAVKLRSYQFFPFMWETIVLVVAVLGFVARSDF